MGYRQMVRHSTLTAAFAGSNPVSPVKISVPSTLYFLYLFLRNYRERKDKNGLCNKES